MHQSRTFSLVSLVMAGVASTVYVPIDTAYAVEDTGVPRIEVQAQIDGRDLLILKGNTMQWHHLDFAAVGRERGGNAPTLIGGLLSSNDTAILWLPVWPLPPPDEIRFEALSSVLQGIRPSIPADDLVWKAEKIFGRGEVKIVEQPTSANGFTLIVEFDDNAFGGSTFYGVVLFPADTGPTLEIDIKPLASANGIDLKSEGNVRVAMRGSGEFDALSVDPTTARLGPLAALPRRHEVKDYNRDGYSDLGIIFRISDIGLSCGDQVVTATAETYGGLQIEGSDTVHAWNCRK